jgi:hypothetical protein
VKAVILHSHAFLTEQNPGLNKYNTEIIDRLMYTLQAAGDENIPIVIPPSLPRQSVDSQQNQDSTRQGSYDSTYSSGCSSPSTEQNPQPPPTQSDSRPLPSIRCTRCEYIPEPTGRDSDRKANLKRHQKFQHECAELEKRTCPVCGKVLSRPDNALAHRKNMHPEG